MLTFEKVKEYYDLGFWEKWQVAKAVEFNKITPEQYEEITGDEYEN
ncbi:XkdX family protein [Bacillus infantis]|nr:XkdX family protein [Bacillus infantis]MCK6203926.1 XkdX family protein [Bacillus infantis]